MNVVEYIRWMLINGISGISSYQVSRDSFLEKKLQQYFPMSIVENAIKTSPAYAGVPRSIAGEIAQKVIAEDAAAMTARYEKRKEQGEVVFHDTAEFLTSLYETAQKILYLYGIGQTSSIQHAWLILGELLDVPGCEHEMEELTDSYAIKLTEVKMAKYAMDIVWKNRRYDSLVNTLGDIMLALVESKESPLADTKSRKKFYEECCTIVKNQMKEASISDPNFYQLIQ